MKQTERLVSFYDVQIQSHSRTFEAPTTISTLQAMELLLSLPPESRIAENRTGTQLAYIKDAARNGDVFHLLINKCDKELADPAFSNPKASQWRTADRAAGEGLDFSCHVVIRTSGNPLVRATAIVEVCPGLPIVFIQRFLNYLLRDVKKIRPLDFTFPHPDGALGNDGRPKTYNSTFRFQFDGHPSNELEEDMDSGSIAGVDLIDYRTAATHVDQHGYVREVSKRVQLSVENDTPGSKVALLKGIFAQKSQNYSNARIRFRTEDGIGRSVTVRTDDFTVGVDAIFVKKERIHNFVNRLKQSYTSLNAETIAKMQALL